MKPKGADALDQAVEAALTTWPALAVDRKAFRKCLSPAALEHAADLYLAFGSGHGDRAAGDALNAVLSEEIPKALARFRQSPAFAADIRQRLLEKLLVGQPAKILSYTGEGPLRPWLRAAAVRIAIDVLRVDQRREGLLQAAPVQQGRDDPELVHIRQRFSGPLKKAVESALAALPIDERNVLRFYFLDGLSVEEIGSLRGIHKSNVSRLISRLKAKVLEGVKATLKESIGVGSTELKSVIRLLDVDLDVSVERALAGF
jgi:RNA polymerase sigma-70 factor (ECF subfamily)